VERQVRTWRQYKLARGTHQLESPDRETGQDMERMQASKGHSHPGEPRWRDKSGHRKHASQQGALTSWRAQTERQVRTQRQCGLGRALTSWRAQVESQVRTQKQCKPVRGTHKLEESRQRDKSGHGNNVSQQGALTSWRARTEGQVVGNSLLYG